MTHRLLLIEPNELTRIGLRTVINQCPGFEIVAEAEDQESALAAASKHSPDLIVIDITLPDCSGLEICRAVREAPNPPKLLLISSCGDHQCMIEAFSIGVEGYLLKDTHADELVRTLKDIMAGKTVLAPMVAEQVVEHMRAGNPRNRNHQIDALSMQERRVLELVAKGKSNRQVADELHLSEKTVKNYFSSVLSKLSANRRTEAAAMFWEYQQQAVGV